MHRHRHILAAETGRINRGVDVLADHRNWPSRAGHCSKRKGLRRVINVTTALQNSVEEKRVEAASGEEVLFHGKVRGRHNTTTRRRPALRRRRGVTTLLLVDGFRALVGDALDTRGHDRSRSSPGCGAAIDTQTDGRGGVARGAALPARPASRTGGDRSDSPAASWTPRRPASRRSWRLRRCREVLRWVAELGPSWSSNAHRPPRHGALCFSLCPRRWAGTCMPVFPGTSPRLRKGQMRPIAANDGQGRRYPPDRLFGSRLRLSDDLAFGARAGWLTGEGGDPRPDLVSHPGIRWWPPPSRRYAFTPSPWPCYGYGRRGLVIAKLECVPRSGARTAFRTWLACEEPRSAAHCSWHQLRELLPGLQVRECPYGDAERLGVEGAAPGEVADRSYGVAHGMPIRRRVTEDGGRSEIEPCRRAGAGTVRRSGALAPRSAVGRGPAGDDGWVRRGHRRVLHVCTG